MQAAEEKTVSAVRAQMAALAEKNGYPKPVALAMVDSDIELFEVEINGRNRLITNDEIEFLKEETESTGGTFKKGRLLSAKGKLLTLTSNEMLKYGISSGDPETRAKLYEALNLKNPVETVAKPSNPDMLVTILTGSALTTILIILGLGALYMEITSPGFGIPGTLAIIIFAVIFISNGMLGYVGSLEILLFIAGIVLLAVEIFLIPGFGAAGISGILLIAASLLLSQQSFIIPEFEWQTGILKRNLLTVGTGIFGSIILMFIMLQVFPRIGIFNKLILHTSEQQELGYSMQIPETAAAMSGRRGKALTTLRPSGKAVFDTETLVVETDGGFIEEGTEVEIITVNSNRIIVKEV
jgi:membrane-bound serine protease (ClpP class)